MAVTAMLFVGMGAGCSNSKQQAERDSLLNQNKDQAAQIQDLKTQLAAEQQATDQAKQEATAAQGAATQETAPPTMAGEENGGVLELNKGPGASRGRGGKSASAEGSTINGAGEVVLELQGDTLFDSGKATLKPSAKKTLDGVVATIKKEYGSRMLRIEGHSDPSPVKSSGWDDNYDLAFNRARAVQKYLISKGIAERDTYAASFGATNLKSTKNYAMDRRVDIVVVR